jgi:ERCC4-related helicase
MVFNVNPGLILSKLVLEGYKHHPYFISLRLNGVPPVYPFAHQIELLFKISFRKPVRVLIGDEIGIGKTVEAIQIALVLQEKWNSRKILVLVPRILVNQWVSELKRLNIIAKVLEKEDLDRLSYDVSEGWYLVSMDLAKRDPYIDRIASVKWDTVIVDEAHRASTTWNMVTLRYKLVEKLARDPERNIILLSATPHRGYVEDYLNRLRLIDPYLIRDMKLLDNDDFYRLTLNSVVVRRTKSDINNIYEKKEVFKGCRLLARVIPITNLEEAFYRELLSFLKIKLQDFYEDVGEKPKALPLLLTIIAKRASSSPYAAVKTLERILKSRVAILKNLDVEAENIAEAYLGLGFEDYDVSGRNMEPDEILEEFVSKCRPLLNDKDIEVLKKLLNLAKNIVEKSDRRLELLATIMEEHLTKGEKVVVFTEYKDTAEYVYEKLRKSLPAYRNSIALVSSTKIELPAWNSPERPDIEAVKSYLKEKHVKAAILTDVASEGLNLEMANILINYEPLWSPVKVEQRIGRVWRLTQERDVIVYTLLLNIDIDMSVLETLYKKLLAWNRALRTTSIPFNEIEIDMRAREESTIIPVTVGVPQGYSEYKALATYLKYGKEGLLNYIDSIIATLLSLKTNFDKAGLTKRAQEFLVEKLFDNILGGFRGEMVEESLKRLMISVAEILGYNVERHGKRIYAGSYIAGEPAELYRALHSMLSNVNIEKPLCLASFASTNYTELYIVGGYITLNGVVVYSEPIGIGILPDGRREVIRGPKLFEVIAEVARTVCVPSQLYSYNINQDTALRSRLLVSTIFNNVVSAGFREFYEYVKGVENRKLSYVHKTWTPNTLENYNISTEILAVVLFQQQCMQYADLEKMIGDYEESKLEVEKQAIELLRNKLNNIFEILDVHERGWFFDLILVSKDTGKPSEQRIVEVKSWKKIRPGTSPLIIYTSGEREFGEESEKIGVNYWLYIVDLREARPKIKGYKTPLTSALKLQAVHMKGDKLYYFYKIVREADEKY